MKILDFSWNPIYVLSYFHDIPMENPRIHRFHHGVAPGIGGGGLIPRLQHGEAMCSFHGLADFMGKKRDELGGITISGNLHVYIYICMYVCMYGCMDGWIDR